MNEHPSAAMPTFDVPETAAGQRLDRYLAGEVAGVSRARIQALIANGAVTCSGKTVVDASHRVKPGDTITLVLPPLAEAAPQGQPIPLAVVYEDGDLIVIDKPAGLVVHPAPGHAGGTLVNALIAHCGDSLSGIGGERRPGIVHRLDKETSGLLVAAKTDTAHRGLSEQFAAHGRDGRLVRSYTTLVWGALPSVAGTIDAPLIRSRTNRTKMAVAPRQDRARVVQGGRVIFDIEDEDDGPGAPVRAREAVTHWHVEEIFYSSLKNGAAGAPLASRVTVNLETGRTHQIRVHMAHIGHPVLADPVYGAAFKASERRMTDTQRAKLADLARQALHASELGFEHPVTGESLHFQSDLPADLEALLAALRGR